MMWKQMDDADRFNITFGIFEGLMVSEALFCMNSPVGKGYYNTR